MGITTSAGIGRIAVNILVLVPVLLVAGCTQGTETDAVAKAGPATENDVDTVTRYCGRCHAPPEPGAHTAAEWPSVIARMQQRRASRGLPLISGGDLERITDYLQRNARGT